MDLRPAAGTEARPARRSPRLVGRVPLAIATALIAAVSLVGPAAAAQPYITRNFVDGPHIDVIDCGSFSATLVRNFRGTDTFFVDQEGGWLRDQIVAHMVGTLTSDTGTVVELSGNLLFVIDFIKGTYAFDGQVFMATRPGLGVVLQDTGKYLTNDFDVLLDAGPHDVEDAFDPFCTALR